MYLIYASKDKTWTYSRKDIQLYLFLNQGKLDQIVKNHIDQKVLFLKHCMWVVNISIKAPNACSSSKVV